MIEAFKEKLKSEIGEKLKDSEAEYLAEKWAEMSMRILPEEEGEEINPPY